MSIPIILNSLRKRISWTTMRTILKVCDLPIKQGWDSTIKFISSKNEEDFDNGFSKLQEIYWEHILNSEKAVQFYQANKDEIEEAITLLKLYTIEKNNF